MRNSNRSLVLATLIATALLSTAASAQLGGHNFRGDVGLGAGSVAPPGWYVAIFYPDYSIDTLRDRNGDAISVDPDRRGRITARGLAPLAMWVSDKKILGGTYSFTISPSIGKTRTVAPVLGLDEDTGSGLGDLYLQPIVLGWSKPRADFNAALGVYVPIGRYEDGADDNTGLGMWSFELTAGTTVYLDAAKSWNLALAAFWETHSSKEGSDQKVGDILTLEGGLGKSFAEGAINVGVAYFGQWKVSRDDFGGDLPPGLALDKHRVYGVGPEVNFPIVVKEKLIALVSARYLWDSGARSTTEGETLFLGVTFPLSLGG